MSRKKIRISHSENLPCKKGDPSHYSDIRVTDLHWAGVSEAIMPLRVVSNAEMLSRSYLELVGTGSIGVEKIIALI